MTGDPRETIAKDIRTAADLARELHVLLSDLAESVATKDFYEWAEGMAVTRSSDATGIHLRLSTGDGFLLCVVKSGAVQPIAPCGCACNTSAGWCGGCGHAGCANRRTRVEFQT